MSDAAETVIEGEARKLAEREETGLAVVPAPAQLAVTPQVEATELVARMDVIETAMRTAMKPDVDYGVIPGTGSKPTLLKPGAEKLGVLFQLDLQPDNEKIWHEDGHLTVISRVTAFHAPTGARLGGGEGICTTREKKYAKRKAQRVCPECGKDAILRSKYPPRDNPDADPGWYCFAKKGGCGVNFAADEQRITSQTVGEIDNPDLADSYNTCLKMAEKRGRVDCVLAVTGASALFTQDQDDAARPAQEPPAPEPEPIAPIPADALFDAARDAGLELGQIGNWLGANGVDGPPPETDDEGRSALDRLDPDGRRRFAASCSAFKAQRLAKAREESQAAAAEREAA